jgi:hypothetical protein
MPVTTAGKQGKDFMSTEVKPRLLRPISFVALLIVLGCSPNLSDDAIPYKPFPDIVLQLSLPEYASLRTDGGVFQLTSSKGGSQGIIVYRVSAENFVAYERNCSYHPQDACATVNVDPSGLYMTDACCGSTFKFTDGTPLGGPAWRPLRQYLATVSGNTVTITDTIIE